LRRGALRDQAIQGLAISSARSPRHAAHIEGSSPRAQPQAAALAILGMGCRCRPNLSIARNNVVLSRSSDRTCARWAGDRYGNRNSALKERKVASPSVSIPAIDRARNRNGWANGAGCARRADPAGELARSADAAVAIADGIGYPVAMKAQAAQLAHKTGPAVSSSASPTAGLLQTWAALRQRRACGRV
jgi:hypothetical protein